MMSDHRYPKLLLGTLLLTMSLSVSADMTTQKPLNQNVSSPKVIRLMYEDSCAACHATGEFNAPLTGDYMTWASLTSMYGLPKLVDSVKDGMAQMPAGGLCEDCSDADYQTLIEFMSQ